MTTALIAFGAGRRHIALVDEAPELAVRHGHPARPALCGYTGVLSHVRWTEASRPRTCKRCLCSYDAREQGAA